MKNNIGELICQYRQMRKITQEEFASRLGVTPQAVSKWERGNGMPDVSLLAGICKVLGISAGTLIGVEESIVENGSMPLDRAIRNHLIAEPLLLEFGAGLVATIESGFKTDYVNEKRMTMAERTGKLMPLLRMRDNLELEEYEYRIVSYDKILYTAIIDDNSDDVYHRIINSVTEVCDKNYVTILNKNIVKLMIDNLKNLYPGVVDGIVPEKISYLQIKHELIKSIKAGKSIRNLIGIIEDMELRNSLITE